MGPDSGSTLSQTNPVLQYLGSWEESTVLRCLDPEGIPGPEMVPN